jgi:hypothetical protein
VVNVSDEAYAQNRWHHRSSDTRMWNVASVRVLNSLSSVRGAGQSEQRELIGRLGAILLYDALGPLLAGENELPEPIAHEPFPYDVRLTNQGEIVTPVLLSPVLSPLPPPPRIPSPAPLPTGSLSVPTPLGSWSQAFGVSPRTITRNTLGGSLVGPPAGGPPVRSLGGSLVGPPAGGSATALCGTLTPLSVVATPRQVQAVPGVPAGPSLLFGDAGCKQPPPIAQVVSVPLSARGSFGASRGLTDAFSFTM